MASFITELKRRNVFKEDDGLLEKRGTATYWDNLREFISQGNN